MIRLVSRVPPTTVGTSAWSLTSALLESLAATVADDGDSMGATSADYESGNGCSEDSDEI